MAQTAGFTDPVGSAFFQHTGVRTLLQVPLRKEGNLLGYISAHRLEVRPFSDKEIALLENFAAQAVIAIENARLITEARGGHRELAASAAVLLADSSRTGELRPVLAPQ